MATTPEGNQVQVSSLPLPPVQYISLYTDENVKRGRVPKPPPPIHDTYKMFGNTYSSDDAIIRPLETQVSKFKSVYPQYLMSSLCKTEILAYFIGRALSFFG